MRLDHLLSREKRPAKSEPNPRSSFWGNRDVETEVKKSGSEPQQNRRKAGYDLTELLIETLYRFEGSERPSKNSASKSPDFEGGPVGPTSDEDSRESGSRRRVAEAPRSGDSAERRTLKTAQGRKRKDEVNPKSSRSSESTERERRNGDEKTQQSSFS